MSRFSGWTMKDIEKLSEKGISHTFVNAEGNLENGKKKKRKAKKETVDYCAPIVAALKMIGVEAEREYKFLHDRRFRFDIAIPVHKIAIEFEGGTFTGGRHTRGAGYSKDAKKYNLATMHGWRLLRYTTDRTNKLNWEFEIADEVQKLINK